MKTRETPFFDRERLEMNIVREYKISTSIEAILLIFDKLELSSCFYGNRL